MKILHITESYTPRGGIEQYLLSVIGLLQETEHSNRVIYRRDEQATLKDGPCPAFYVPSSPSPDRGRRQVLDRVAKEKPDLVFLHAVHDGRVIEEVAALAPTAAYIHGFTPTCPARGKFFRTGETVCSQPFSAACIPQIYLRRCSEARHPATVARLMQSTRQLQRGYRSLPCLIVAGEYMEGLLAQNGFDRARIRRLPPHFQEMTPYTPPAAPSHVLFAGRLEIEKGLGHLLQAMRLSEYDYTLLVAGDGSRRQEYEALTTSLGLTERVRFLGWQDGPALSAAYRKASLVVMPTVFPEPFGKVGIEALAHGRPVVAFRVGGIPDWLQDGVNGFLVPALDTAELARRMDDLLADPSLSARMGLEGRSWVAGHFSPVQYRQKLLDIFNSVISPVGVRPEGVPTIS